MSQKRNFTEIILHQIQHTKAAFCAMFTTLFKMTKISRELE